MKQPRKIFRQSSQLIGYVIVFGLGFILAVFSYRPNLRVNLIALESDGRLVSKTEMRDSFSGASVKLYCYYIDDSGNVVKNGQELEFAGALEIADRLYRDGKMITSISTMSFPSAGPGPAIKR